MKQKGQDPVYNLYKYNLNNHSIVKITNYTDWNVGAPSYSEDGQRILCVLFRENISQIYTMASDGTSAANLTTDNTSLYPRFAQKDKKIVFCATSEEMGVEVYMMNANGTDRKKLSPLGGSAPSWAAYIPVAEVPTPVGQ